MPGLQVVFPTYKLSGHVNSMRSAACCTLLILTGCGAKPQLITELPLLEARWMTPSRDVSEFAEEPTGGFRYPKVYGRHSATENAFEKDDDATSAAIEWIHGRFDSFTPDTSLEVVAVEHSSSGRDRPSSDAEKGHTITFLEAWSGYQTDRSAVIYISGRTWYSGTIQLATLAPKRGSSRAIVSKDEAVRAFLKTMPPGISPDKAAEIENRIWDELHIKYVWAPPYNEKHNADVEVLSPNWTLKAEDSPLVDAYTGRIWRND